MVPNGLYFVTGRIFFLVNLTSVADWDKCQITVQETQITTLKASTQSCYSPCRQRPYKGNAVMRAF